MGRYTGPVCRICRREGMKLHLKAARCLMAKCPVETGRPVPGMHGQRRKKVSEYGTQLREKQKLRKQYGMMEGQFKIFFQRAQRKKGITGEMLLQMLESRLDNLVYRFGFATSRRSARMLVTHDHVLVNGKKVNIPSMVVKPGSTIQICSRSNSRDLVAANLGASEGRGISPWLNLDAKNFSGEYARVPTRDEIAPIVDEQLVVELYSK